LFCRQDGSGQGEDASNLDKRERALWRKQALDWLQADLVLRRKQMSSLFPFPREEAQFELRCWQHDSSLSGIRDKEALAKLSTEERLA
jgi:hypothetical protein